jgi:hypothetical protein
MGQPVAIKLFMPIIPRHHRLMVRLVEQKTIDTFGCIGWRGLMDENELFTIDQLFKPLVERGLVEDLSKSDLGNAGAYFVRITPLGEYCLALGYMLREPRVMTDAEVKRFPVIENPTDAQTQEHPEPSDENPTGKIIEGEAIA